MGSAWRSQLCLGLAARCLVLAMLPSLSSHHFFLRQLRALDLHRRLSWLLQRRLGLCLFDLLLGFALDIVDVAVLVLGLGIHAGRARVCGGGVEEGATGSCEWGVRVRGV